MPVNRRFGIDELLDACAEFVAVRGRRITFEWALIAGEVSLSELVLVGRS